MNQFEKALKGSQRELELEDGEHRWLEETFEFKYIFISILCHSRPNILNSETLRTNQKIPYKGELFFSSVEQVTLIHVH